ncbi:hypothetical protein QCN27_09165 [Cereibacter sp. SYSU M97828]|nr:hypothetical protein [Cereibacter flavus]
MGLSALLTPELHGSGKGAPARQSSGGFAARLIAILLAAMALVGVVQWVAA